MVEQETIQPEYVRIGIAGDDAAQEILIKQYFDIRIKLIKKNYRLLGTKIYPVLLLKILRC